MRKLIRTLLLALITAGCEGVVDMPERDDGPPPDPAADAAQGVGACTAPVIVSPTAGASTGLSVTLKTTAASCLTATRCYLNGNPTAVAGAGAGAGINQAITVPAGDDTFQCNGWDAQGNVYKSAAVHFTASGAPPSCGATVPLASLTAHNTSAFGHYDQAHFPANFGTSTWISQSGMKLTVDPSKEDLSLNPVTPGHVSHVDVHTLIPSRPDLRWFAHLVPWFRTGGGNHIDIGLNNDSAAYAQAVVEDIKARGFDGFVIDWYGKGSYTDSVLLLIQQYLKQLPNNHFKFIIMMDKGIAGLSQSVLESQIRYVQAQYFNDPNYEREGNLPILMFFGVDSAIGTTAMAAAKANTGGKMVWVSQGVNALSRSYVDQSFDWTHDFHDGPSTTDPYNLAAVSAYYSGVKAQPKKAFGSMTAGFNGMLTRKVAWSMGKYLPRGHGACIVQWAKKIDQVIPANVTRMQWATWDDWEEGSAIEGAVENDLTVHASITGSTLGWSVSGGTGDESTLDHYEVWVSSDGVDAARLGNVAAGTHSFALNGLACLGVGHAYKLMVIAVGKPSIRNHATALLTYSP